MKKLYIYNPTCDMAVENGTLSYMPSANLRKFEEDITPLLSFMASNEDKIYSQIPIDNSFVEFWKNIGFSMPMFINEESISKLPDDYIIEPWGWSPVIANRYKRFKNFGFDFKQQQTKRLFSRYSSVDLLHKFNSDISSLPSFIHIADKTSLVFHIDSINSLLNQHPNGIVLKTMYSSSGRGLLFINNEADIHRNLKWIEARIKAHGAIVVEPYLNKLQDASLQFIILPNKYEFLGLNFFDADSKGRFNKEHFRIPNGIKPFLPKNNNWIQLVGNKIIEAMKAISLHEVYNGPVGVDAIFFNTDDNQVKFNPLLEANLRCNMGLVNINIKKRVHEKSEGTWQIDNFKSGEAKAFYEQMRKQHPISILNGKIEKGFAPLTPFTEETQFAAWMLALPKSS